ncbi:unnamed protein product [Rotaria sp. Silwood2]|nr:unnamed protein product [Rotaria sp. Silwood2]CAF2592395.1 unnamed protein product [Rotaria sp. Silwood2]CAF2824369.1 unnamed protein product [Rotaria sp. Silwood2]CAF3882593.1 unnamed protein product [Rotaria sp. Silwood2]CAF3933767.1 unnamed protein product [Rotaria sp. Silwood2]
MLEIQPYRLIGQSLQHAVQYLIDTNKSLYFHHIYSSETPNTITLSLRPTLTAKRLLLKRQISLIDYLIIEILHHYFYDSLSKTRSSIISSKPALIDSVWQHILTYFILNECSPLVLLTTTRTTTTSSSILSLIKDFNFWSDEQAYTTLQRFIKISTQCANHGPESRDYAHANEYLISVLQKMAITGVLFSI